MNLDSLFCRFIQLFTPLPCKGCEEVRGVIVLFPQIFERNAVYSPSQISNIFLSNFRNFMSHVSERCCYSRLQSLRMQTQHCNNQWENERQEFGQNSQAKVTQKCGPEVKSGSFFRGSRECTRLKLTGYVKCNSILFVLCKY